VHEYCKAYAAGLHVAESPYAMVRVSWHSKPKLLDGRLFFSRQGRTSEVTNRFLNRLVAEYSGFGTEVIATGNAGEHALTLDLGMRLRMAGGFAVEPYQFLELFEQFGGVLAAHTADALPGSVPVVQIETRNPHFHDDKGEGHVRGMRVQALNALYHSSVALDGVRGAVVDFLVAEGMLAPGVEPPRERVYPPVGSMALDLFLDTLSAEATTFRQVERYLPARPRIEPPILRERITGVR
jgi:mannosyl-3-phosphoglycerate synthase